MNSEALKNLHSTLGRNELPWQPIRRLGDASLKGFRVAYPGQEKIVQVAKNWIENYRGEQFVRDLAMKVTRGISRNSRSGHPDMRNFDAIAKAIHDFIVREINYVRDENSIERLQTPDATLQLKSGDCDDMVILGGAMLESVGVPTRIKRIGERKGEFTHVFLEYNANGQWKSFDPTLALYPGFKFPKHAVADEKINEVARPVGLGNFNFKTHRTMESGFISQKHDKELGFDFKSLLKDAGSGAAAGTAVPGAGNVVGTAAGVVTNLAKQLLGRAKNKKTDCGSKQREVESIFSKYLTQEDVNYLFSLHTHGDPEQRNRGYRGLAFHYLGGDNCVVDSSGGRSWSARVDQFLQDKIDKAQAAEKSTTMMSTATMGGINPMYLYGGGALLLTGIVIAAIK